MMWFASLLAMECRMMEHLPSVSDRPEKHP